MAWTRVDIETRLQMAPEQAHKIDPYWAWAELTGWLGFTNVVAVEEHKQVPIIARLADGESLRAGIAKAKRAGIAMDVPPLYLAGGTPQSGCRCFTARVPRSLLHGVAAQDWIARWELGSPLRAADIPVAPPAAAPRKASAKLPKTPLLTSALGLIDDGFAVINRQFSAPGRALRLWDQDALPSLDDAWLPVPAFGYGRQWIPAAARQSSEADTYAAWHYLQRGDGEGLPDRTLFATHGTHLLSVLAGFKDPLQRLPPADDPACSCPLVLVGLPGVTVSDSSGGSLPVYLLDGIRYILGQCTPKARVVVSVSYGSQAGPHDGSSLIETAMDELLQCRDGFEIVLSAGNSRQAAAHAMAAVSLDNAIQLQWEIPEDDTTDSFVEFWYGPSDGAAVGIRITAPDGTTHAAAVLAGECLVLQADSGEPIAALVHRRRVPNGNDAMALLALAPTHAPAGRASAHAGRWKIEVSSSKEEPIEVHAYIERDDPGPLSRKPASRFVEHSTEAGTLNGIATGRHTLVAGGCYQDSGLEVPYSSQGPTRDGRRQTPDVLAACEQDRTAFGIRGAAVRSPDTFRMDGTSVSAPVLARRVFTELVGSRHPRPALDGLLISPEGSPVPRRIRR